MTPSPRASGVRIGGDDVPYGTHCEEDELITYRNADEFGDAARLSGSGVGCVHYEYVYRDFLFECGIIGTPQPDTVGEHAANGGSNWCTALIDDASDGTFSLDELTGRVPRR